MRSYGEVVALSELPCARLAPELYGVPRAVIVAPPGAGKTTLAPVIAADQWARAGRIVVAEPRRIAVRAAARRLAHLLGESVGERVGYTIRGESRTSAKTRVEFVTTGVLVRRLLSDPELSGVSAVILDEVHERSLDADLALAFCLDVADLRDDLALWAMSATLEGAAFTSLMDGEQDAREVHADVRAHPLEVRYAPPPAQVQAFDSRGATASFLSHVARQALAASQEVSPGSVLVFVPSVRDVETVVGAARAQAPAGLEVLALHGSLPSRAQDHALAGSTQPRIVVATSVAETGLTVPGVRAVVDSTLARQPRYDAQRDTPSLVTVRTSQASAEQRAGRAARLGPGLAVRLIAPQDFATLRRTDPPEVHTADLTGAALALAAWGDPRAVSSRLLDNPPAPAFERAREVLAGLGAQRSDGSLTPLGERLARAPVPPRQGAALFAAAPLMGADRAARLTARLASDQRPCGGDARTLRRMGEEGRTAARLRRLTPKERGRGAWNDDDALAVLIALAHPGFIARLRSGSQTRYLTASGIGIELARDSPLIGSTWLAVAEIQKLTTTTLVRLAAPLAEEHLTLVGRHLLREHTHHEFAGGRVRAWRVSSLGAIVLHEEPTAVDPGVGERLARDAIRDLGWHVAPKATQANADLFARLAALRGHLGAPWPDLSDDAVRAQTSLAATCVARLADGRSVRPSDVKADILAALPWPEAARLDELAPTRVRIPSGREVPVDYEGAGPRIGAKLQEFFGAQRGPRILGTPVTIELYAPNGAILATTADLASFWTGAYPQVRAEMRGRYPKHPWPADPATATPTALTSRALRQRG
ncbi:MAG: ATP-dependent helicase HrpB [Bowdeniella nasicola]|nr:ATP-dependent helicase HrpB [Bowdeniella nasicola]